MRGYPDYSHELAKRFFPGLILIHRCGERRKNENLFNLVVVNCLWITVEKNLFLDFPIGVKNYCPRIHSPNSNRYFYNLKKYIIKYYDFY